SVWNADALLPPSYYAQSPWSAAAHLAAARVFGLKIEAVQPPPLPPFPPLPPPPSLSQHHDDLFLDSRPSEADAPVDAQAVRALWRTPAPDSVVSPRDRTGAVMSATTVAAAAAAAVSPPSKDAKAAVVGNDAKAVATGRVKDRHAISTDFKDL